VQRCDRCASVLKKQGFMPKLLVSDKRASAGPTPPFAELDANLYSRG